MIKIKPEISNYINSLTSEFRDQFGYGLDINNLCKKLKIKVFNATFDDKNIAGAIEHLDDGSWQIQIKETDNSNRKRFTAAHELGHYISWLYKSESFTDLDTNGFHTDFSISKTMHRSQDNNNKAEYEANEIAGRLLMPRDLVDQLVKEEKSIEDMAICFGVSIPAMTVRLKNLGYTLIEG